MRIVLLFLSAFATITTTSCKFTREFDYSPQSENSLDHCGPECVVVKIKGNQMVFARDVMPLRDILNHLSIHGKYLIDAPDEIFDSTTVEVDIHAGVYSSLDKFLATLLFGRNIGYINCKDADSNAFITRLYQGKGTLKFVDGRIVLAKSGKPIGGVFLTTQFGCGWSTDDEGDFIFPMDTTSIEPLRRFYVLGEDGSISSKVLDEEGSRIWLSNGSVWAKSVFKKTSKLWLLPASEKLIVNTKSRELSTILKQISNQTGYLFVYRPSDIDGVKVKVPKDSLHLAELLKVLLKKTDVKAKWVKGSREQIILVQKTSSFSALDSIVLDGESGEEIDSAQGDTVQRDTVQNGSPPYSQSADSVIREYGEIQDSLIRQLAN